MGFFGWVNNKHDEDDNRHTAKTNAGNSSEEMTCSNDSIRSTAKMRRFSYTRQYSSDSKQPAMDHLPDLIRDISSNVDPGHSRCLKALRKLFALSEHSYSNNRAQMVKADRGSLVPTLLCFLKRCTPLSSEQYLTLLVLNNISMAMENKRAIALTYDGARILSQLLCENPSCHLLVIVLVNLTFADDSLRKDLVSDLSSIGIVESLAFTLRISSLTREEYEERKDFIREITFEKNLSPAERLAMLMAEDHRLRPEEKNYSLVSGKSLLADSFVRDISQHCFSETARWCLSALKNLSKPCKDASAAHVLITSGILSLVLEYVSVRRDVVSDDSKHDDSKHDFSLDESENTPTGDPLDPVVNSPSDWDSNSMQDAALYIVLNLAACPMSRDFILENDVVEVLAAIADYEILEENDLGEPRNQLEFQSLKARMALGFLFGSQGHFGQAQLTTLTSTVDANPHDSPMILNESNLDLLLELLANVLHQRGKEGPGGYSATTFNLKYILHSLRCLLTHTSNQSRVAALIGLKINVLLMKALAEYSVRGLATMDEEAAEHAIFSLYLMSNYGFVDAFLPSAFTKDAEHGDLAARVFTAYKNLPSVTPAGFHAVNQLLLRLKYLSFEGDLSDKYGHDKSSDFSFDDDLLLQICAVDVGTIISGAKPLDDIFDRPILRTRKPKKGRNARCPWENRASVSAFENVLQAVQQLSYGSIKVRHSNAIDDIVIANNIANSARGEKTESYNFMWVWEENVNEISRNLERQSSTESRTNSILGDISERFSLSTEENGSNSFRVPFVAMCSEDTTV